MISNRPTTNAQASQVRYESSKAVASPGNTDRFRPGNGPPTKPLETSNLTTRPALVRRPRYKSRKANASETSVRPILASSNPTWSHPRTRQSDKVSQSSKASGRAMRCNESIQTSNNPLSVPTQSNQSTLKNFTKTSGSNREPSTDTTTQQSQNLSMSGVSTVYETQPASLDSPTFPNQAASHASSPEKSIEGLLLQVSSFNRAAGCRLFNAEELRDKAREYAKKKEADYIQILDSYFFPYKAHPEKLTKWRKVDKAHNEYMRSSKLAKVREDNYLEILHQLVYECSGDRHKSWWNKLIRKK